MSALIEYGRAKVNLTLRVVGRRVDGYHDLESVVAFADCADRLSLTPGSDARAQDHRTAGAGLRRDLGQSGVQGGAACSASACRISSSASSSSTRCCRSQPELAAVRPMPPRRCGLLAQLNGLAIDDPAPDRGRATDRRRRAGMPRLARLRHDRRRRKSVAAGLAEDALRDGQSARLPSRPRTCSRRSACAMASCWWAPPT